MIKTLIALSCTQALLNGNVDSNVYSMGSIGAFDLYHVPAKEAVSNLLHKYCPKKKVSIDDMSCREIQKGNPDSRVCYVETEVGYFFVTRDMMENVSVVFNRYD